MTAEYPGRQLTLPGDLRPTSSVMEAIGIKDPHATEIHQDESAALPGGMLPGDNNIGNDTSSGISEERSPMTLAKGYTWSTYSNPADRD